MLRRSRGDKLAFRVGFARGPDDAPIPRPDGADPRRRRREARPHRHRHAVGVRPSDALRPRRGLSAHHHQEAAPQVDRLRAALVPGRRHQRQISQRARRHDLGRMGGRARRARPGLRPAVALVAGARWRHHRPDRQCGAGDPPQSRFAPPDRHRLEPGRRRQDGTAAVPLPVPVLRGQWPAVVPALSALGRCVPRRAVQHRLLRAAHPDGGAGDRARARRVRLDRWATVTSTSIISSRRACSSRARRGSCRAWCSIRR